MGRPSPECRSRLTFDRSPVRESRTPGSARGAGGNSCPYRDAGHGFEQLRRKVLAAADVDRSDVERARLGLVFTLGAVVDGDLLEHQVDLLHDVAVFVGAEMHFDARGAFDEAAFAIAGIVESQSPPRRSEMLELRSPYGFVGADSVQEDDWNAAAARLLDADRLAARNGHPPHAAMMALHPGEGKLRPPA